MALTRCSFLRASFHRHIQPPTAMTVTPRAPRFSHRPGVGAEEELGVVSSRYTSALDEVVGRGRIRRSGAGTQRVRYANASEAHTGHRCASWTSSQSRQRRAIRSRIRSTVHDAPDRHAVGGLNPSHTTVLWAKPQLVRTGVSGHQRQDQSPAMDRQRDCSAAAFRHG